MKETAMTRRLILIASVTLASLVLAAQDGVSSKYDHTYDFSRVKTFALKLEPARGNPAIETFVREVVGKELNSKGWTQATDDSAADVLVVIKGAAEDKEVTESFYEGTGRDPGWPGPAGVSNVRVIREKFGQGTVEIFDTKTNALLFTGSATGEISRQEKKNEKAIKRAVEKLFRNFPPKTGA